VLFTVAALAYVLDLISKMIVVAKLEHHEPIEIIGDWLRFEAIRNAGAAFGFGEAFTIIFTVIAAAVIVVIARLARKLYSLPWAIALGLLLGGAMGNLTDRIFRAPGCSAATWSTGSRSPGTTRFSTWRRAGPGMKIVYSDDDIVVVDKPVGVAAHPSPGWTGPTVIGGLAAMGRTSRPAAPPSGRASCTGSTSAPPG
jgi:lipoprotein signal peptidase